ncbi:hypothetical protein E2C01_041221 [Portunus trituberculatus]|uniref:Uncharacterized protein n=1 Tax=Portunus trituberculatus TaxID=210409 RepID=A0A5B7FR41_PORTR|nr:hypothetical protein [Portunus trituberculatus]
MVVGVTQDKATTRTIVAGEYGKNPDWLRLTPSDTLHALLKIYELTSYSSRFAPWLGYKRNPPWRNKDLHRAGCRRTVAIH